MFAALEGMEQERGRFGIAEGLEDGFFLLDIVQGDISCKDFVPLFMSEDAEYLEDDIFLSDSEQDQQRISAYAVSIDQRNEAELQASEVSQDAQEVQMHCDHENRVDLQSSEVV
jgi:hypothetical protein